MTYTAFKNKVMNVPLILSRDLLRLEKDGQIMRNQLNRWQKKGLLVKLKRGVYLLNENDRRVNLSRNFIANQLYVPSYMSMESALVYSGLIPERAADLTSVTTRKTMVIKNKLGRFVYQHIKPEAFRGFKSLKDSAGFTFFIAEPEKAMVDFLYLNLKRIPAPAKDIFEESFRFQNMESLKTRRIIALAKLFNNRKLMRAAADLCALIKKGR